MPNPNLSALGKTVLTTAKGDVVVARNAIQSFGMRHPLSLAFLALTVGNAIGVFLHI